MVKQILTELGVNIDPTTLKKRSAQDLVGILSKEDAKLMEQAIEEACDQIHPDDWK